MCVSVTISCHIALTGLVTPFVHKADLKLNYLIGLCLLSSEVKAMCLQTLYTPFLAIYYILLPSLIYYEFGA